MYHCCVLRNNPPQTPLAISSTFFFKFGGNNLIFLKNDINDKDLLYSPGNHTHYPVRNHHGKEYEKAYT